MQLKQYVAPCWYGVVTFIHSVKRTQTLSITLLYWVARHKLRCKTWEKYAIALCYTMLYLEEHACIRCNTHTLCNTYCFPPFSMLTRCKIWNTGRKMTNTGEITVKKHHVILFLHNSVEYNVFHRCFHSVSTLFPNTGQNTTV